MKKWKEIINQKNVNAIRLLQYQILSSWFFSLNVHVLPSTMYQKYYKMNVLLWYSYICSTLMSICLFICTRCRICFDYVFVLSHILVLWYDCYYSSLMQRRGSKVFCQLWLQSANYSGADLICLWLTSLARACQRMSTQTNLWQKPAPKCSKFYLAWHGRVS